MAEVAGVNMPQEKNESEDNEKLSIIIDKDPPVGTPAPALTYSGDTGSGLNGPRFRKGF